MRDDFAVQRNGLQDDHGLESRIVGFDGQGDGKFFRSQWEKGVDLFKRIKVPPARPLSPEEALKTFRLDPGYRIELVAAEPMVQNPIFFRV